MARKTPPTCPNCGCEDWTVCWRDVTIDHPTEWDADKGGFVYDPHVELSTKEDTGRLVFECRDCSEPAPNPIDQAGPCFIADWRDAAMTAQ